MVDSSDRFQLVSVAEAARILSVSDSTIRRLLKAGRLEAEQVQRPQGHVWLVKVPSPGQQPPEQPSRQIGAAGANPSAPPALAAWMTSVLEPLVAELAASRQQNERQADRIGELEREAGRLTAELDAEKRAHSPVQPNLTPDPPAQSSEPTTHTPWLSRRRAFALAGIVLLAGAGAWLLLTFR